MIVSMSFWHLGPSIQTIESMRVHLLQEGVDEWRGVAGLNRKIWLSDPEQNLWGAVMFWSSREAHMQSLPPNRSLELIGHPPSFRGLFQQEASVGS